MQSVSVIVPVGQRCSDPVGLHKDYKTGLEALSTPWEIIYVLDGPNPAFEQGLRKLADEGEAITVLRLSRPFGEATALMAGFERTAGDIIVTLPAYHQVEGSEIPRLVAGLSSADLCIARRSPRKETWMAARRRAIFHALVSRMTDMKVSDLGCGARAMRRQVLEEITLYGDQHRFIPMLADRQGFRVREIDVKQSPLDHFEGTYGAPEYARRVLDLFTVFFLVRFTKKPLRLFGMVGAITLAAGLLVTLVLVVQRLFFEQSLADRPALLLSSLLIVLGLQIFALGLLGELLIFTHARNVKDYQIERVIEFSGPAQAAGSSVTAPEQHIS